MFKNLLKLSVIFSFFAALFLVSCEKDSTNSAEIENFTDETISAMQDRVGCGKHGCYEFVFPLSVALPGEDTVEVADYKELHETIRSWKEDNPDNTERPQLVFSIEIMTEGGELIILENQEALHRLRRACHRAFHGKGPRGHWGKGYKCLSLVFPLTVIYPENDEVTYDTKKEMKTGLREWKLNNPGEDRPELKFPIKVELEDETVVDVDNKEDLKELKESCRG